MPTSADLLLDTSAAIALISEDHVHHTAIQRRCRGLTLGLAGHAAVETYSVLTRMPGAARLTPRAAATVIEREFPASVALARPEESSVPSLLATAGIAGGAVYDGLVALAARTVGVPLLSCDRRAAFTYAALGVPFEII